VANKATGDSSLSFFTTTDGYQNAAERLTIQHNGNVGIGTTSPGAKLHIYNAGNNELRVEANEGTNDRSAKLSLQGSGNGGAITGGAIIDFTDSDGTPATPGALTFQKSSSTYMTILNGGNVGIGTTAPGYKLDVVGLINSQVSDGNTGFRLFDTTNSRAWSWYPSGGHLRLWTTTTGDLVTIQNGGNVGIGTTAPGEKLHVYGGGIEVGGTGVAQIKTYRNATVTADMDLAYFDVTAGANDTQVGARIMIEADANWTTGTSYPSRMGFNVTASGATSPTRAMTIDSTGYLGLGEASPGSKLSVSGGATIGATYDTFASPSNGLIVEGNVGIGTTTPAVKLEVSQELTGSAGAYTDWPKVRINSPTNSSYNIGDIHGSMEFNGNAETPTLLAYIAAATTRGNGINYADSGLYFGTSYSSTAASYTNPQMVIKGDGNVGIGTTNPDQKLDVIGTIQASNLLGGALNITTDANGNIIRDPSDRRLKENIQPIENALDKVMRLRGVTYNWKDRQKMGSQTDYGMIAQEVAAVTPELTATSTDGVMGVKYTNMVGLLVNAIQEQQTEINDQGTTISNLDLRISESKIDVAGLQAELNDKLDFISGALSRDYERLGNLEADVSDIQTRLAAAETKLIEQENNLASFQVSTTDTLSAMLETENILTERVLNHEERIAALEAKLAVMTLCSGGETCPSSGGFPSNVIMADASGNARLAGVFEAEGIVAGSYAVKNDPNKKTTGTGEFLEGESEKMFSKTDDKIAITESAKIFVTFENDPGARWWVEKNSDLSGFAVKLSEPASGITKFTWWIVEER
jgi:hypothetical protein